MFFFCKSWWGIYWYFTGQAFNGSVILSFGTPIIALFYYSFKLIPLLTLEVTVSYFKLKLWCWIRLATVLQVFYAIWWGQDLATNSTVLIILWNILSRWIWFFIIVLSACSCSDYVNENGIGNCTKRISLFNWQNVCYVNQPSSCSDLIDSGTDVGKQISVEACGNEKSGSF